MALLSRKDEALERELGEARRRIAELETELGHAAVRDQLTDGLLTMRAFRAQLELDVQRAHRYGRALSVAVIDIDGFRAINLEHGYAFGDDVLIAVARLIGELTRSHDICCRVGDEFPILLPETGPEAAVQAAERILLGLRDLTVGPVNGLSASAGIAALHAEQSPEQLLSSAHAALEQARVGGGGSAVIHWEEAGEEVVDSVHGEVIAVLAAAVRRREGYTSEHGESVASVAGRVAESLGLDERAVCPLRTAGAVHAIGKVGIPDELLHKAGRLDELEWEVVHQHPLIAERILSAIPGLGAVARIVRQVPERWDGSGYPDGRAGPEIELGSRIVQACAAYHSMRSERSYRPALSHAEAIAELTGNAGSQFDPRVVEALVGYLYGRQQASVGGL